MADLRGAQGTRSPPGPNSFNFMQFFGKIRQIRMLAPPGELAPPPRGNPGSTTGYESHQCYFKVPLKCMQHAKILNLIPLEVVCKDANYCVL